VCSPQPFGWEGVGAGAKFSGLGSLALPVDIMAAVQDRCEVVSMVHLGIIPSCVWQTQL
jgi:hypothetical protein